MPTASSWSERLSGKVRTLWHCSRLRSVALYLAIDRGDIRQAIDRCSNIWASLPGAGYGQFEHKASLIAKFKEAGGTASRDYGESHRDYLRSGYRIIVACHGPLIITDNAITYKAQRDKMRTEAGERGNY